MFRRDLARGARFFIGLDASSLCGYGGDLFICAHGGDRQIDTTQCGLDAKMELSKISERKTPKVAHCALEYR